MMTELFDYQSRIDKLPKELQTLFSSSSLVNMIFDYAKECQLNDDEIRYILFILIQLLLLEINFKDFKDKLYSLKLSDASLDRLSNFLDYKILRPILSDLNRFKEAQEDADFFEKKPEIDNTKENVSTDKSNFNSRGKKSQDRYLEDF